MSPGSRGGCRPGATACQRCPSVLPRAVGSPPTRGYATRSGSSVGTERREPCWNGPGRAPGRWRLPRQRACWGLRLAGGSRERARRPRRPPRPRPRLAPRAVATRRLPKSGGCGSPAGPARSMPGRSGCWRLTGQPRRGGGPGGRLPRPPRPDAASRQGPGHDGGEGPGARGRRPGAGLLPERSGLLGRRSRGGPAPAADAVMRWAGSALCNPGPGSPSKRRSLPGSARREVGLATPGTPFQKGAGPWPAFPGDGLAGGARCRRRGGGRGAHARRRADDASRHPAGPTSPQAPAIRRLQCRGAAEPRSAATSRRSPRRRSSPRSVVALRPGQGAGDR